MPPKKMNRDEFEDAVEAGQVDFSTVKRRDLQDCLDMWRRDGYLHVVWGKIGGNNKAEDRFKIPPKPTRFDRDALRQAMERGDLSDAEIWALDRADIARCTGIHQRLTRGEIEFYITQPGGATVVDTYPLPPAPRVVLSQDAPISRLKLEHMLRTGGRGLDTESLSTDTIQDCQSVTRVTAGKSVCKVVVVWGDGSETEAVLPI